LRILTPCFRSAEFQWFLILRENRCEQHLGSVVLLFFRLVTCCQSAQAAALLSAPTDFRA
jgi:hypothetical protein